MNGINYIYGFGYYVRQNNIVNIGLPWTIIPFMRWISHNRYDLTIDIILMIPRMPASHELISLNP
jgi:hypothetical protein